MSLSPEQIQAVVDAVAQWRLQECIVISSYVLYIYYVLTTIDEEVSVIFPQRWNCGKWLFMVIRYSTLIYMALQLLRDYRSYYILSPETCKALVIIYDAAFYAAATACNVALGLCLSALLQVRKLYLIPLTVLCAGPLAVGFVFSIVSDIQFNVEALSALDRELGYPCHASTGEDWAESTIDGMGSVIRNYVNFAIAILLLIFVAVTFIVRYRGHKGRLVQVLRRDAGLYYISLAVIRFGLAVVNTPAIIPVSKLYSIPVPIILMMSAEVAIPILAQRLLLNIRKADFMGRRPYASKLLFAPPNPDSEDDINSFELDVAHPVVDSNSENRSLGPSA